MKGGRADIMLNDKQRKCEALLGAIKHQDEDAYERYSAALEAFWFDGASLLDLIDEMRATLKELIHA